LNRHKLISSFALIVVGQALIPAAIAEKFVCSGDGLSPNYELIIARTEVGFAQVQLNPMIGDVERSLMVISETERSLAWRHIRIRSIAMHRKCFSSIKSILYSQHWGLLEK
jgi:hypothetical protein